MKEELETLDFKHEFSYTDYNLNLKDYLISISINTGDVYLYSYGQGIFMFKYELNKLKQLIKLLQNENN